MCRGQSHLRIACNSDADFASVGENFENEQVVGVSKDLPVVPSFLQ
jgi:hypothetical protein